MSYSAATERIPKVIPTRARYPDADGCVEPDGVRVAYEIYGAGEPSVLLLPTSEIVHSRAWKCQIPYLARHARVVTFDRRGSGRSDTPAELSAYDRRATALDALAAAIAEAIVRDVDYLPVPAGGAARAAGLIADLITPCG